MPSDVQKRIIDLRKKANLSQKQMADNLKMTRTCYAYNETRAKRLDDSFIECLAKYHKVSTNFIRYGLIEKPQIKVEEPKPTEIITNVFTNKEKKLIEKIRCLSVQKQNEIRELIENEYKAKYGISDDE